MLGIQKNPKLHKIREANPLNNIVVPRGSVNDLDARIEQFNALAVGSSKFHPLLTLKKNQFD